MCGGCLELGPNLAGNNFIKALKKGKKKKKPLNTFHMFIKKVITPKFLAISPPAEDAFLY